MSRLKLSRDSGFSSKIGIILPNSGNALKLPILPSLRYFCIILKIFYDPIKRTFLATGEEVRARAAHPLPTGLYSKSCGYKKFSVHTNTKKYRFQIAPLWKAFSKSSVFVYLFMRIQAY